MQFGIRALFVAMLLVAVAAVTFPRDTSVIAAIPGFLWVAGIACGIVAARGKGLRCISYSAIGGAVGATLAVGAIGFFDAMEFASWHGPPTFIALGGISGAFLGCVVVAIMEGVVVTKNWRAHK